LISVWLSTPKKTVLLRQGLHSHVRTIVTWSSVQASLAAGVGVPQAKLALIRQRVDDRFWRPDVARAAENLIVAVGAEARDYPTLMEAVRGIDATAEVAIGSMVHTPSSSSTGRYPRTLRDVEQRALPPNVRLHRNLAPSSLRDLYARARVVVVPLVDVEFDAGATAIMEAMAMGKPLVLTKTRGQVDLVPDGAAGIYVPPGDPRALREAIDAILTDPGRADALGRHGRELVERRHRLDDWLDVVAGIVDGTIRPAGVRPIDYGTVLDGAAANGA
jgi:glycosyltransferase involved in cell wall biosynthesis